MSNYKNISRVILTGFVLTLFLSGCVKNTPDMYHWGEYESLIYQMYVEAGSAEADVQIEKLKNDILQTRSENGRTPPGVYAHLGFMYASVGKVNLAVDAFNQEKALFPESAKFINGMMKRAFKGSKS